MKRDILLLTRGVVGVAVVQLLLVGGQLALDLAGGYPLGRLAAFDLAAARHLNNVLNRNLNQLLAVTFTTVAIAVPLTANLYSLKFLEFFIKDPVNTAVLVLVVLINLNNTTAADALKDDFVPLLQLHISGGRPVFIIDGWAYNVKPCRYCGHNIALVPTSRGRLQPRNADGSVHFATCGKGKHTPQQPKLL